VATTARRPLRLRRRLSSRTLDAAVPVSIWSSPRTDADEPLPLLVVHDGPDYSRRGRLQATLEELGLPLRVALLTAVDRNETYSASAAYVRALTHELLPAIDELAPRVGPRVGLGASLGALALLHAHCAEPRAFGGLFLQSGSYFRRRTDAQEARFERFGRIDRFVRSVERETGRPIPVTLTCGLGEENLANNCALAASLARGGYDVRLHAAPGSHDWPTWRTSLAAHLAELLQRVWR
jgi:enterochelin esterase-like enzyme